MTETLRIADLPEFDIAEHLEHVARLVIGSKPLAGG